MQLVEAGADPKLHDTNGSTEFYSATRKGHQACTAVLQEWHRAHTLYRARSVRELSLLVGISSAPVDAAPMYLVDRVTAGLTVPTVHVRPGQPQGEPSDGVGKQGHTQSDLAAIGDVVAVHVIEELNAEVFVEGTELMGVRGCGTHELEVLLYTSNYWQVCAESVAYLVHLCCMWTDPIQMVFFNEQCMQSL